MITTPGNILLNDLLPPDTRDYSRVMDKKALHAVMSLVGKNHPTQYAEIAKQLKALGDKFSYELGASFDYADFKPKDLSHIYDKYNPALRTAGKIESEVDRHTALRAINLKMEDDVNALVKKDMLNPDNFQKWGASGAKGKNDNYRQINYAVGNQVDLKNNIFPYFAKGSLSAGLSPTDYYISALGARRGVVNSFIQVRDPGAFAKELFTMTNDMVTTMHDCGTHIGKEYNVKDMYALGRYLLEDIGNYKRNEVVTTLMQDNLARHGIQRIKVRTPLGCQAKEGLCAMCVGPLENGMVSPIGDAIGIRSAQSITEPLTQLALSSKHTGGVVSKKTAFETIKQLMHVPENFPGAAVLAHHAGIIGKIEDSPDGGKYIHIGDHSHYALPVQGLKVKTGDRVERGDVLTEGLVNPAMVVHYKGMEKGREFFANQLHKVYQENGVEGHPKIFEAIARSVLNLGKIVDPGDHDFLQGDIVNYGNTMHFTDTHRETLHPLEATGWRLNENMHHAGMQFNKGELITSDMATRMHKAKMGPLGVYKNPVVMEGFMMGTERAALHKGVFSNLGFRFVKQQLLDNIALAKGSDMHSFEPALPYAMGVSFGKGEGGRY